MKIVEHTHQLYTSFSSLILESALKIMFKIIYCFWIKCSKLYKVLLYVVI